MGIWDEVPPNVGKDLPGNKKNILLVKDGVGKPKPTTRSLPTEQHLYGKKNVPDKHNCGVLLGEWKEHDKSCKTKSDRDFTKSNFHAIVQGKTSAKECREFTKSHDYRKKEGMKKELKSEDNNISTTFGKPSRPHNVPIDKTDNIVGGFYGNLSNAEMEKAQNKYNDDKKKRSELPGPKPTKGSLKRNEKIQDQLKPVEIKEDFKIKKFNQII